MDCAELLAGSLTRAALARRARPRDVASPSAFSCRSQPKCSHQGDIAAAAAVAPGCVIWNRRCVLSHRNDAASPSHRAEQPLAWPCGFGVLGAFWWTGHYAAHGRSFLSFRSATLGDAVLLPIALGVLVGAAQRLEVCAPIPGRREKRIVAAMTAAGAIGGSLSIRQRLQSHTLDWTLDAPHRFNLPGYWHAGFLTVSSAIFGRVGSRVLYRARLCTTSGGSLLVTEGLRSWGALAGACITGFTGLLVLDSYETVTAASIAVVASSVLLSTIVAVALSSRPPTVFGLSCLAGGEVVVLATAAWPG